MTVGERFLQWTLQTRGKSGPRHVGKCGDCGEFCVDTSTADEAQDWCLKHVRATETGMTSD